MASKAGPVVTVKFQPIIVFLGMVLLLVGIFASARTVINFYAFARYPTTGVLSLNLSGFPPLSQREEDCFMTGTVTYYTQDGKVRSSTTEDKVNEKRNYDNCIASVLQSREAAKVNDISMSLLFFIMGIGLLVGNRFIFR